MEINGQCEIELYDGTRLEAVVAGVLHDDWSDHLVLDRPTSFTRDGQLVEHQIQVGSIASIVLVSGDLYVNPGASRRLAEFEASAYPKELDLEEVEYSLEPPSAESETPSAESQMPSAESQAENEGGASEVEEPATADSSGQEVGLIDSSDQAEDQGTPSLDETAEPVASADIKGPRASRTRTR